MILQKIYNRIKRQFAQPGQVDYIGKYVPYFEGGEHHDNFPNALAKLVDNSPTATACLSTVTDFITGEGFNGGSEIEDLKINYQGTTFFNFHAAAADSMAHSFGVAWMVKYNKLGQITELYNLPFGNCRLGIPDKSGIISHIVYNPYFGTSLYNASDNKCYPTYDPLQVPLQATNPDFDGQIMWYGQVTTRSPFYPVPPYYSARSWMSVENNAGIYFEENLENGFLQPQLMEVIGNPNDTSGVKKSDGTEYSKGEWMDEVLTNQFSGARRVGNIWVMWAENQEGFAKVQAFPANNNGEMYRIQDEHAIKKITIATKVPGVLANINDTNNFSGEQIRPAVALMQQRVARPQATLISLYQDALSRMVKPYTDPIQIIAYDPFPEAQTMDPQVWAELSPEERRQWIRNKTEVELIDPEPVATSAPSGFVNFAFNSYPEKAGQNVKRAVEWMDKMGKKCGGAQGMKLAQRILTQDRLSTTEIKRLSNYLSKNAVHKDKPFDASCDSVLYALWGGTDMMVWANEKIKEING